MSEQVPPEPPLPDKPDSGPAKSTRRQFLRRAGAAAGFAAVEATGLLGALTTADAVLHINPLAERIVTEPNERLKRAGLSEYTGVYEQMDRYQHIFGDEFMNWNTGADFPVMKALARTLHAVTRTYNNPSLKNGTEQVAGVDFFKDGWGEQKHKAVQKAFEKVDTIQIVPEDNPDNGRLRAAVRSLPQIMPGLVNGYGEEISMVESGGVYLGVREIGLSYKPGEAVNAMFVAIHEGQHALLLGTMPEAKRYVDKDKFAKYAETYVQAVGETFVEWTDTDFAVNPHALPLIDDLGKTAGDVTTSVGSLEALAGKYSIQVDLSGAQPAIDGIADDRLRATWKYNAVLHPLIKRWKDDKTADKSSEFLNDPSMKLIVEHAATAVAHRFVFDNEKFKHQSTPINQRHTAVWNAFLGCFSNYEGEPTYEGFLKTLDRAEIGRRKNVYEEFGWKTLALDDDPKGATYAPYGVYKVPTSESEDNLYYLDYSDNAHSEHLFYPITFQLPKAAGDPRDISFVRATRRVPAQEGIASELVQQLGFTTSEGDVKVKVYGISEPGYGTLEDDELREKYKIEQMPFPADKYKLATQASKPWEKITRSPDGTPISATSKAVMAIVQGSRLQLFEDDTAHLESADDSGLFMGDPRAPETNTLTVKDSSGEFQTLQGMASSEYIHSAQSVLLKQPQRGMFTVDGQSGTSWGFRTDPSLINTENKLFYYSAYAELDDTGDFVYGLHETQYDGKTMPPPDKRLPVDEVFYVN